MSKLTMEEAAKILDEWYTSPETNYDGEALRMGASALHHQHENRWRRLSEEKPTEDGHYLVKAVGSFTLYAWAWYYDSFWHGHIKMGAEVITHWKPLDMVEDENEA